MLNKWGNPYSVPIWLRVVSELGPLLTALLVLSRRHDHVIELARLARWVKLRRWKRGIDPPLSGDAASHLACTGGFSLTVYYIARW